MTNVNITSLSQAENKIIKTVKISSVTAIVIILSAYFYNFNGDFGSQEIFGSFGDFVGGTLNPIFSFITITLLIWSIQIQVKELRETRKEFERSAKAQEEIDKNQKAELAYYKKKESVENIKFELTTIENKIDKVLKRPFDSEGHYSLESVMTFGLKGTIELFEFITEDFDYDHKPINPIHYPIVNIITSFISLTTEYEHHLKRLLSEGEPQLYLIKMQSFLPTLESLSALGLGKKLHFNGIASSITKSICDMPDLKDDYLNGLKTFSLERINNIYQLTEKMKY